MSKSYQKNIDLYGDGIGKVEYVQHMGDDQRVVNAARVSFGKEVSEISPRDEKLINYLIKHKHSSVLEHCNVTFRFKVPLFIRSQHHRHRTWSYNEISRRYTNFNLEFYEPKQFRKQSESNRQASVDEWFDPEYEIADHPLRASDLLKQHHDASLYVYNKLLELGVCREQARGALPQNLYTEYYGTCNLNNLFKFIALRIHEGAQWEIQEVAKACLKVALDLFPITTNSFIINLNNKELKKEMLEHASPPSKVNLYRY
jgi:thymidylate synthase (FAD)